VEAPAERVPAWRAILDHAVGPFRRMWGSNDPLDAYALVHMASAAGDALVAIALADSVFFSLPVDQAKLRVALYLGLTMAPLAAAAPFLVPLLDRTGFRRAMSFAAAAGRAVAALYAAPRLSSLLLFPLAFAILVLSRVHAITKNGLTMAYAPAHEGLVRANARLGRIAVGGVALATPLGLALLKVGGAGTVLYLAAAAYLLTSLLVFRLPHPDLPQVQGRVERAGRIVSLRAAAAGMAGLRGASGFLLFLMAFALRGRGFPAYWFGILAGSAVLGGFLGDVVAPRLSRALREEAVVFGSLVAAGGAAIFAFVAFDLVFLALFTGLAGMATEFGRLAFQSLMQRSAPIGAHGRVFVRYEVLFQLSWVAGAFLPAIVPIPFRTGVLLLAIFYLTIGLTYLVRPHLFKGDQPAA
jgi:Major Facilitator Superfamily